MTLVSYIHWMYFNLIFVISKLIIVLITLERI